MLPLPCTPSLIAQGQLYLYFTLFSTLVEFQVVIRNSKSTTIMKSVSWPRSESSFQGEKQIMCYAYCLLTEYNYKAYKCLRRRTCDIQATLFTFLL